LVLVKALMPGSAAGQALAGHPSSILSKADIKHEEDFAEKQSKEAAKTKQASAGKAEAANKTSANKAKPANQHGSRSSAKTNRDLRVEDHAGVVHTVTCDFEVDPDSIASWRDEVLTRWDQLGNTSISFEALAETMTWRLRGSTS